MKALFASLLFAAAVLVASPVFGQATFELLQPLDGPRIVAIVDVSVIPMDEERVITGQTVVVVDGRIAVIGAADVVDVPGDALVVDGSGRYLMPGLAEMHAHIPGPQQGAEMLERTLFLFVANGVTTLRGMLGHPDHLDLRARAATGETLLPRIYTSSPSINGNSAPTPEAGRELVRQHHAGGYDFLKIHPGLSRETYDAVVDEARDSGIEWAGHVPAEVGLYRALEVEQITIDHLDGYMEALGGRGDGYVAEGFGWFGLGFVDEADETRIPGYAAATREAGVWNVPTQSLMEHLLAPDDPEEMAQWPEMRYMPQATLAQWKQAKRNILEQAGTPERAARFLELRRDLIASLQQHGAGLLLGADAPQIFNVPGFSVHRELQYMVDSGLTPYEALLAGTRTPASFFDTDEWGVIAEGRIADLVLLDGNPLADIAHSGRVAGMMVNGHWLPRAEIDARLAVIEERVGRME
jgi:hypothetical protein